MPRLGLLAYGSGRGKFLASRLPDEEMDTRDHARLPILEQRVSAARPYRRVKAAGAAKPRADRSAIIGAAGCPDPNLPAAAPAAGVVRGTPSEPRAVHSSRFPSCGRVHRQTCQAQPTPSVAEQNSRKAGRLQGEARWPGCNWASEPRAPRIVARRWATASLVRQYHGCFGMQLTWVTAAPAHSRPGMTCLCNRGPPMNLHGRPVVSAASAITLGG